MSEETTPVTTTEAPVTAKPTEETAPAPKDDSEKSYEELKAEAEAAEAAYKEARGTEKNDELRNNMIARRDKALAKAGKLGETPAAPIRTVQDVDVRDLMSLSKADISEDSEEAKILEKYKQGGIIKNYADGLKHPGVRAEFDAIAAKNKSATVISENDSDEVRLRTTKEIVHQYEVSGEIPEDQKSRDAIVAANLKKMGF